jgi:dTMP kinase
VRGRLITFEGGEGTGKSTQVVQLAKRLKDLAIDVVITREPGGSPAAEVIRHVILSGAAKPFGPEAEAVLFAAARADHVANTIAPALERGAWVICDRYIDSTRAYQGELGNVDPRIIRSLERLTVGEARPDLTLILDLPPRTGLARAAARRGSDAADRFEQEALDFHTRLRRAFRNIARDNPDRCVLIDAKQPIAKVAADIWNVVNRTLDPASAPLEMEDATS